MKVKILYFDGCPTYLDAEGTMRKVLAVEGVEAEMELVAVNTDEEAKRLRFPGSPTIWVDGEDLFPTPEREDWRPGCRVYATPDRLRGSPTAEMIRAALR
jgi:hypothetical protein